MAAFAARKICRVQSGLRSWNKVWIIDTGSPDRKHSHVLASHCGTYDQISTNEIIIEGLMSR